MKLKILLVLLIINLSICLFSYADSDSCITESPSNITYYGAVISGVFNTTADEEYGFELWENGGSTIRIISGYGTYSGTYNKELILIDDTQFNYRTYVKQTNNQILYGDTVSFKTDMRKEEYFTKVNLDFSDVILEKSSLQESPNKFLVNNLILNNTDALQLVVGQNFNNVSNVEAIGDENIFINHFFMNEYYKNDYLRWMLTLFDVALYNRDEYVSDAIVFIPKSVINSVGSEYAKKTANSIFKNMSVKRYEGAINSILSSDYISASKKTFGYEKSKYNFLNSLQKGTSTTNKLINNFVNGTEKLVEGIEDYQSWYFNDIMPKYSNASNNLLKMNEYLITNAKNMDYNLLTEYTEYLRKYSSEVTKYETLEFAYDKASAWKFNLEKAYYAKEASNTLDKAGKILSIADGTLNMLKTWNQVNDNEEVLKDTFIRLHNQTNDKNLKLVLNDYVQKMDNDRGVFILSSFSNIYNTLLKTKVEKTINQKIADVASDVIADNWGAYTDYATDKALSKANYLLLAADAGAFFAEQISSTETLLEKSVEIKYLWKLENYSKEVLQNDINKYKIDQSEENARNILNDLLWIKSIKLRAITVTNELYQANGNSKYISLFEDDCEIYEYINSVFENQKDALINASLIEGAYTSEPLKIESGETYVTFDRNNLGHDAAIIKNNSTKTFYGGVKRLIGGIELCNGASLLINNQNESVYIPYLHLTGGTFTALGKNIVIGELIFESGNIHISNDSKVTILGGMNQESGVLNVNEGTLCIKGDYSSHAGTFDVGDGRVEIDGNFSVSETYNSFYNFKMNNDNAYMKVCGDFSMFSINSNEGNITAGTLELKGNFAQKYVWTGGWEASHSSFPATGTHKVIFSGDTEQTIYFAQPRKSYFNIVEISNTSMEGVRFNSSIYVKTKVIQPTGTTLTNMNNVKIGESSAFVDYGELNSVINEYVGNAYSVIPTYVDYEEYMKTQVVSIELENVEIEQNKITGNVVFNNKKGDLENVFCIIAAYMENELINCEIIPISINHNEIKSATISLDTIEMATELKVYLWNDMDSIMPLCEHIYQ